MRDLPLVRIGLGLMAVIALIALAVNLGERDGASPASTSASAASPADPPADADVAEHWRALAPTLVLVDSAVAIEDPERRTEALKAVEDQLERAEERAPGAGELEGSPRREYRQALERLRDAADVAEEPGAGPEAMREVAEARNHLHEVASRHAGGASPSRP